jgi:hypothetical protein
MAGWLDKYPTVDEPAAGNTDWLSKYPTVDEPAAKGATPAAAAAPAPTAGYVPPKVGVESMLPDIKNYTPGSPAYIELQRQYAAANVKMGERQYPSGQFERVPVEKPAEPADSYLATHGIAPVPGAGAPPESVSAATLGEQAAHDMTPPGPGGVRPTSQMTDMERQVLGLPPQGDQYHPWADVDPNEMFPSGEGQDPLSAVTSTAGRLGIHLMKATEGVYNSAADLLGVPVELVGAGLREAGINIIQGGEPTEALKRGMHAVGIGTDPGSNFASRVGNQIPEQLLSLAAVVTGAGYMAKVLGGSVQPSVKIVSEVAKWFAANPGTQAIGTIGATVGGQMGHDAFGGELGDQKATILGALLGGAGLTALVGIGRWAAQNTIGTLFKSLKPSNVNSVMDVSKLGKDIQSIPQALKDTRDANLLAIGNRVQTALDTLGTNGTGGVPLTAGQISNTFFDRIKAAHDFAGELESQAWGRIPMRNTGPFDGLIRTARGILGAGSRKGVVGPNGQSISSHVGIPDDFIARVLQTDVKGGLNLAKPGQPMQTSVERLLQLRSDIDQALRDNRWGRVPGKTYSEPLARSLGTLKDAVSKTILQLAPGPEAKNAITLSKQVNDLFSRGPLGGLFRTNQLGDPVVTGDQAVQHVLKFGAPGYGTAAVKGVENAPSFPPGQTGFTKVGRWRAGGAPPGVVQPYTDAVRAHFQEAFGDPLADLGEPGAALGKTGVVTGPAKWLQTHETNIKGLGQAWADMDSTLQAMKSAHVDYKALMSSNLSKALGVDGDKAINTIFTGGGVGANKAQELLAATAHNPAAHEALQYGIMMKFFQRTLGADITQKQPGLLALQKARAEITNPSTRDVYKLVLGPDKFKRLEAIVGNAENVANAQNVRHVLPAGYLVRSISAMFGAKVGRSLGTGTIQVPGRVSNLFQNIASGFIGSAIPAPELFARALVDPRWEKVLHIRAPSSPKQVQYLSGFWRSLLSTGKKVGQGAMINANQQQDDDPNGTMSPWR